MSALGDTVVATVDDRVVARDLRLALRQRGDALLAVLFFVLTAMLFPFGIGQEPNLLQRIADSQEQGTFQYGGRRGDSLPLYTSGECAMWLNSSAYYGSIKEQAEFEFGQGMLPRLSELADAPQNSIIGGATLWVLDRHEAEEYEGVAKFFEYLSSPEVQATWHQQTGYVPITTAAYELSQEQGFYEQEPGTDTAIQQLSLNEPTENSRGIRLGNFVQISERGTPPQLFRFNRLPSATVSAALAPGYTVGDGVAAMEAIAAQVLDPTFSTALTGPTDDFAESSNSLYFVFGLALLLIYLVLAAQFESFRDPATILLTVPLALAGGLLALWYIGQTINIFSQIGMIMLIGIVTKNGILIVEFANQRREAGLDRYAAAIDSAAQRFRPILMTSLATMRGALPLALALGGATRSRIPLGVAIIGGLAFSLLLTLYLIPALYSYISPKEMSPHAEEEADQAAATPVA